MKKILGLSVAALMVMGLVGGGTWAYFNDIETIADNAFTAGTLYLDVNTDNIISVSITNQKPVAITGATEMGNIVLTNGGSLNGTLTSVGIYNIRNTDGTTADISDKLAGISQGSGDLSKYLKVAFFLDLDNDGALTGDDKILTYDGSSYGMYTYTSANETAGWGMASTNAQTIGAWNLTLDDLEAAEWPVNVSLDAAEAEQLNIFVYYCFEHDGALAKDDTAWTAFGNTSHALYRYGKMYVQNIAQGDSVLFDITFTLDQD